MSIEKGNQSAQENQPERGIQFNRTESGYMVKYPVPFTQGLMRGTFEVDRSNPEVSIHTVTSKNTETGEESESIKIYKKVLLGPLNKLRKPRGNDDQNT